MEKRPKRSKGELEVQEYLESIGEKVVPTAYGIAPGFEVDLYLPEHNLGIEYNGLYWHNENRKGSKYHLEKLEAAERSGKRLIQIFEDEWLSKREIVKRRLAYITGHLPKMVGARECEIRDPEHEHVRDLLNTHHLQGSCAHQVAKGAYFGDTLVAVMTFSKTRVFFGGEAVDNEWELVRFAAVGSIPGAASRILKAFRKEYPNDSIISYADRRWSDGGLYRSLGFTEVRRSQPNYWYVMGGKRMHRYNFAKHKLVEQGFDPAMTEEGIMLERGFLRIWDCGTLVYRLDP